MYSKNKLDKTLTVRDLTPYPFDSGDLKWNLDL
jgi:hypothetical protein